MPNTLAQTLAQTLAPEEVALFRALIKSGVILLVMLRLARPTGAREIADILGLDEHTVAKHLRSLAQLNLVTRISRYSGYILLNGSQLVLGKAATVKIFQSDPTTINRDIDIKNGSIVIVDSAWTVKNLQSEALSPTEQALKEAGIGLPKRQELASQPDITPEAIHAWEANLKHEKGSRYTVGLLIHILENGEPPPPVNQNGHHLKCECAECERLKYQEWCTLGKRRPEDDDDEGEV